MIAKKYVKDYKLVDNVTERGGIRTEAEYIGGDYYYAIGGERAARLGRLLTALSCAGCILYMCALLPSSGATHLMYVVLPFAFSALPLGFMTASASKVMRAGEPMRHEAADRVSTRLPACAMWTLILSGVAFVGEGVSFAFGLGDMVWGDAVFALCSAGLAGVSAAAFTKRDLLRTVKR